MFARFLVFLLLLSNLFAQQLPKMSVIGKAEKSSDELVAKRDANGRYCAGIKVVSNMDGFSYDSYNGVVDMDDKPGEDLIYLQPDERVLLIYHEGYEPLKLILSEYGIHLHPREVWTIKIGGEALNQNGLSVVFLIQPTVEQIEVDGKRYDIGNKKPVLLAPGQHKVKITKRGYRTIEKEITVDKEHVLFSFNLQEVDLVPVTINSQPTGAQIFIDGMERGRTSKAMNLFPDTYQLKLTLQGYLLLQQTIEVKENQSNNFNFNLVKNVGYLKVNIEPNDALLTINGKTYSYNTAIELLPGQYQITVSKSGYLDITDQIEIKLGETVTRNYRLTKNSGTLVLNVNPYNAQILINKEDYTGKNQIELPPGLYRLEISADGYYGITENVTIERGQTLEKSYQLRQKTGKLNFAVSPAEAQVTLKRNGQVIKTWQGANYLRDLPVGTYSLEIRAKGYIPQTKPITISEQQLVNVDVTLKEGIASKQSFTVDDTLKSKYLKVGRGYLGVYIKDVTPVIAKGVKLDRPRGVFVDFVIEGGAAYNAGIKVADIILSVDGEEVNRANDLVEKIGIKKIGELVTLKVWRDGKELTIKVKLRGRNNEKVTEVTKRSKSKEKILPILGMQLKDLTVREKDNFEVAGGAMVTNVEQFSAASQVRISPGDVIIEVGGEKVKSVEDLYDKIEKYKPGDIIKLKLRFLQNHEKFDRLVFMEIPNKK